MFDQSIRIAGEHRDEIGVKKKRMRRDVVDRGRSARVDSSY